VIKTKASILMTSHDAKAGPIKMRIVFHRVFEWHDRIILTAVKAMLLFAVIVAFLSSVVRAGLRHFSRRRHSRRFGS